MAVEIKNLGLAACRFRPAVPDLDGSVGLIEPPFDAGGGTWRMQYLPYGQISDVNGVVGCVLITLESVVSRVDVGANDQSATLLTVSGGTAPLHMLSLMLPSDTPGVVF